ncbi:MAG: 4-hydroxy-tetrahydrodipicolinate reductase [Candidatus Theseobacter exili]|nr:4-hydroxy-tetrahydrodipicolinate reductase [Candidatus Theseobacter exili]
MISRPVRVTVCGALGKMGDRIMRCILEEKDLVLVGAIERDGHPLCGNNIGGILGREDFEVILGDDLGALISKSDVVIDFTSCESTTKYLKIASSSRVPVVIGTTGFSSESDQIFQKASEVIPIVKAPNMSVGINLLYRLVAEATKVLNDYDVEIVETHHRFKKDAPSGTALQLARVIADTSGRNIEKDVVYGREGVPGPRKHNEIGLFAVRSGDVIGEHTVIFGGLGESIELTHRAHTRDTFARGALRAARFVIGRSPGLYDMTDVLGLKEEM